ncbi:MAG: hypothetical protein PHI34_02860 [Acidobacteriota bacterium]|nr:hypothetical protein [Acidobacteriota bacterium]
MTRHGCTVCGTLRAVETSFSKYGSPALERPLPAAAARLQFIRIIDADAPEKSHVRRCPACASLFAYRLTYDYQANGSEDEETLARLSPDEAASFRRREALAAWEALPRGGDSFIPVDFIRFTDYADRLAAEWSR